MSYSILGNQQFSLTAGNNITLSPDPWVIGSAIISASGGSGGSTGSPTGSNGAIQFNNNGEFGGDSHLLYNSSSFTLSVPSISSGTGSYQNLFVNGYAVATGTISSITGSTGSTGAQGNTGATGAPNIKGFLVPEHTDPNVTGNGSTGSPYTSTDGAGGIIYTLGVLTTTGEGGVVQLSNSQYSTSSTIKIEANGSVPNNNWCTSFRGTVSGYGSGNLNIQSAQRGSVITMGNTGAIFLLENGQIGNLDIRDLCGGRQNFNSEDVPYVSYSGNTGATPFLAVTGNMDQCKFHNIVSSKNSAFLECVSGGVMDTCVFDNINCDGSAMGFVISGETYFCNYINCIFADLGYCGIYSINVGGSQGNSVSNCRFVRCAGTSDSYLDTNYCRAELYWGTPNGKIENNIFNDAGTFWHYNTSPPSGTQNNNAQALICGTGSIGTIVSGNQFYIEAFGNTSLASMVTLGDYNLTFVGNYVGSCQTDGNTNGPLVGVTVKGQNITITGNTFIGCSNIALLCKSTSGKLTIEGNTFIGSSNYYIYVEDGANNVFIGKNNYQGQASIADVCFATGSGSYANMVEFVPTMTMKNDSINGGTGPNNYNFIKGSNFYNGYLGGNPLAGNYSGSAIPAIMDGVNQVVAGTNVTVSPSNGYGNVVVNSLGAVYQLVAGTNVTLSPTSGTGTVTINSPTPAPLLLLANNNSTTQTIAHSSLVNIAWPTITQNNLSSYLTVSTVSQTNDTFTNISGKTLDLQVGLIIRVVTPTTTFDFTGNGFQVYIVNNGTTLATGLSTTYGGNPCSNLNVVFTLASSASFTTDIFQLINSTSTASITVGGNTSYLGNLNIQVLNP